MSLERGGCPVFGPMDGVRLLEPCVERREFAPCPLDDAFKVGTVSGTRASCGPFWLVSCGERGR